MFEKQELEIIRKMHGEKRTIQAIADELGKPYGTVYRQMMVLGLQVPPEKRRDLKSHRAALKAFDELGIEVTRSYDLTGTANMEVKIRDEKILLDTKSGPRVFLTSEGIESLFEEGGHISYTLPNGKTYLLKISKIKGENKL